MNKIALLGFGKIGKIFFKTSKNYKNVIIKDIVKKKIIGFKNKKINFYKKIKPLITDKDIKGFIITTPVKTHWKFAKEVIKTQKPFIIEKPVVAKLEELKKIHSLTKNYKKSIFVNYKDLYNPAFEKFLKEIKSIGSYNKIKIIFGRYQEIKKFKISLKSNILLPSFDWLPHPIALSIILGGVPKKVSILKNKISFTKKFIFQESIINFFYKKKNIEINFANNYKTPKRRIVIYGSKGTLIYDAYKKSMLMKKLKNRSFKKVSYKKIDSFNNLFNKFILSINGNYNKNDMNLSFKVMKILFDLEKSMKRMFIYN